MPKITKKNVSLIDAQGFEWVRGEFTEKQLIQWIKRYKMQGVYLSARNVRQTLAVAS